MDRGKQIEKAIVASVLFCALMLPTALQFSHFFQGHEHIAYNDSSTHLHQEIPNCQICHFHSASFNYDVAEYPELLTSPVLFRVEKHFSPLLFNSFKDTNTRLRAPPHFLS